DLPIEPSTQLGELLGNAADDASNPLLHVHPRPLAGVCCTPAPLTKPHCFGQGALEELQLRAEALAPARVGPALRPAALFLEILDSPPVALARRGVEHLARIADVRRPPWRSELESVELPPRVAQQEVEDLQPSRVLEPDGPPLMRDGPDVALPRQRERGGLAEERGRGGRSSSNPLAQLRDARRLVDHPEGIRFRSRWPQKIHRSARS